MEAAAVLEGSIPEPGWSSALEHALAAFATKPHFLIELDHTQETTPPLLIGFYEKKGTRVEAAGMLALTPGTADGYLPAPISQT
jgi:hypothetical protein